MDSDPFVIAGKTFSSRLIVGTGKYTSHEVMQQAHEASGTQLVTVAVRRVNVTDRSKESLLDFIDSAKYALLPNTAGCYTAEDALTTARLARDLAERGDGAAIQAQSRVGDDQLRVNKLPHTQTIAGGACTERIIEGKQPGLYFLDGSAPQRARGAPAPAGGAACCAAACTLCGCL